MSRTTKADVRRQTKRTIINATTSLPNPELLASELAPVVTDGAPIAFLQRRDGIHFKFENYDWLIELDAAMHEHGAYDWAGAVTNALYLGDVHITGPYWDAHYEALPGIVQTGELMVFVRADGTWGRWTGSDGSYFTLAGTGVDPSRWEPNTRYGINYRRVTQQEEGIEFISWRDLQLGLQLAELVLSEMEADELIGLSAADAALSAECL